MKWQYYTVGLVDTGDDDSVRYITVRGISVRDVEYVCANPSKRGVYNLIRDEESVFSVEVAK